MATPPRPSLARQLSRVPGGFDTDDELSPIKTSFDGEDFEQLSAPMQSQAMPTTSSQPEDDSLLNAPNEDMAGEGDTFIQEKEMRLRLEEVDSTFLPEISPAARPRVDEAFVFGQPHPNSEAAILSDVQQNGLEGLRSLTGANTDLDDTPSSPATPSGLYQTPAPGREDLPSRSGPDTAIDHGNYNTSSLGTLSSSPTAAAVARTVSRAVSMASMDAGYETADDSKGGIQLEDSSKDARIDDNTTPRKTNTEHAPSARDSSPTPTKNPELRGHPETADRNVEDADLAFVRSRKRPQFLNSRMASQRSSYSSHTTTSTEGASNVTLGADFALQSGGAVPQGGSISSRPTDFSRTISLGSMASGISDLSDGDDRIKSTTRDLHTVDEEDDNAKEDSVNAGGEDQPIPETPRATGRILNTPTDTVIAQHVRDIEVPATMAKEYQDRHRHPSPDKRNGAPTPSAGRSGKNLTLKEQSSTIDRLMKENWDLKLKINFLDDALSRRSDEGVKAMISENVDLRTAKFKSAKEMREMKRTIRELERKLKEKADELANTANAPVAEKQEAGPRSEDFQEMESEVTYLRERIMTYEVENERMRHESFAQEREKKRLAEVLKRASESNGGIDMGAREEVDMWKDLLDAETARREQADEDNRRLRDEIRRLKSDASSTTTNNHATNVYHVNRRQKISSTLSYNDVSDREPDRTGASSAVSSTLVEQLRHENAELRREVGAQTSMLTSRNREKERLYQEIEDLKLGARRGNGTRSIAGDSIFERSASRAHGRPASRASDQTRITQMSDAERDAYEMKNGELRDQNAGLKLEVHDLTRKLEELLDELEQLDAIKIDYEELKQLYDNDVGLATEDLKVMQVERDEALRLQEDMEAELQDLKAEGNERIGALEEEVDQKNQELQHLHNELSNHAEDSEALRKEVRTLSESILQIEEEMESKNKRIRDLQLELEELGHEADTMDKDLREERDKTTKLTVQQESGQSEIAFLREEQDGDKIKIGDLEDALNNLRASLFSEKDRAKDLDARLADERHQREVIGTKEKQEVQKMTNDLNRELSSAKEESRNLKKNLQSREIEANTFKERLNELESHLREVLGDPEGTRSTFLTSITKLQKELESTFTEIEIAQHNLSEKDRLVKNRDALLESHGLESKKLSELLDRERQGRRADKAQHDQWQKTHQHTSRTVSQKDVRITELESSRQSDRKKISALENQFKDQLSERNTLLLTLWNRLSIICGSDWQHQNSLVNNHLPTLDVVANSNMLPIFGKNLLSAAKTVEGLIIGFQGRIRTVERDLWTEYQSLEQTLDTRIKKLDRLESTVQSHRISGTFTAAPEIAKLRGENRLLKSELAVLHKQEMHARNASRATSDHHVSPSKGNTNRSAPPPTLARHYSSSAVEQISNAMNPTSPPRGSSLQTSQSNEIISAPIEPSQQRWIHRLRELERRLKAEREARLLDRSGARKRLEEGAEENRRLKGELERERVRAGGRISDVSSENRGAHG
ncbi:Anucleate primary sterigmata protein B [Mycoblastus sanguinarius]|nr:Anucleate primary sterigmata protein B [Mycoblastus sanguinarius]